MNDNALVPTVSGASVPEQPSRVSTETLRQQIGSGIKLTDDQRRKLVVDAGTNIINLKPTGEIYVPGVHWRALLNQVFDPFGWGVRGGAPQLDLHEGGGKSIMYREVYLLISRCTRCMKTINVCQCGGPYEPYCAATGMGAQEYHPTNKRLSMDDAAEGALTNGLMRCCKVFGIYDNVWDPVFAEATKYRLGVKVVCKTWDNKDKDYWRLLDSHPLDGEYKLAQDSPNAEAYRAKFGKPTPPATQQAQNRPAPPKPPAEPLKSPDGPKGDKILVCRSVKHADGEFWVLNLDPSGDYIVEDRDMVTALENAKVRGLRIEVVTSEQRHTTKGQRRALIEFRLCGPAK